MGFTALPALAEVSSGTGSPDTSALSFTGALSFNGQPVYVSTGNVLGSGGINLQFALTNPVVIGDLKELLRWAGDQFGIDLSEKVIDDVVDKVPVAFLRDALQSVLGAQLVLTILNVSIQPNVPSFVQVGATLAFNPAIGPSWFNLQQVGFMFTKGQQAAA